MNTSFYQIPQKIRPTSFWSYFSKAYEAITNHGAQSFRFEPGKAPMATNGEVLVALATYYTVILGGRELMRGRKKFELNGLFKIHNFYLTAISAILLVLHLEQIVPTLLERGVLDSVCRRSAGWTSQLEILYYVSGVSSIAVRNYTSLSDARL